MSIDHHSKIETRAYCIWESEGRRHGMTLEHWLRAERARSRAAGNGRSPGSAGAAAAGIPAKAAQSEERNGKAATGIPVKGEGVMHAAMTETGPQRLGAVLR